MQLYLFSVGIKLNYENVQFGRCLFQAKRLSTNELAAIKVIKIEPGKLSNLVSM